ncbi:tyrosine-type recombinase/integrase [Promicromonospora sp. Populi]|uniref:tyrosine-type recombinase/integrase n=1 Tax=Promicromonospora sp. Populi TaxID=3239420 RepID=UPI0034E2C189
METDESKTPIPVARELVEALSASMVGRPASAWMIADDAGGQVGPWQVQRAVRAAREAATYKDAKGEKVEGLPEEFRFHDLRHYYASLLISERADVKVVQARLRHASAKTTLDTYADLWPDTEESTRTATGKVIAARVDSSWTKGSKKAPKARNLADQA